MFATQQHFQALAALYTLFILSDSGMETEFFEKGSFLGVRVATKFLWRFYAILGHNRFLSGNARFIALPLYNSFFNYPSPSIIDSLSLRRIFVATLIQVIRQNYSWITYEKLLLHFKCNAVFSRNYGSITYHPRTYRRNVNYVLTAKIFKLTFILIWNLKSLDYAIFGRTFLIPSLNRWVNGN